tara:strand:- start:11739 stop:11945 length:207 start_codon:yes stop_codon:yes gene_type:complete
MTKQEINEKFFENLFQEQMKKINKTNIKSSVEEAHEIITTLLFEWETNSKDKSITDRAIKWLSKNSKI